MYIKNSKCYIETLQKYYVTLSRENMDNGKVERNRHTHGKKGKTNTTLTFSIIVIEQ